MLKRTKLTAFIFTLALLTLLISGCGSKKNKSQGKTLNIPTNAEFSMIGMSQAMDKTFSDVAE